MTRIASDFAELDSAFGALKREGSSAIPFVARVLAELNDSVRRRGMA